MINLRCMKKKLIEKDTNGFKNLIMILIICLMLVVGYAVFARFYFTAERTTMSKLDFLAKTYYEDYYYDHFADSLTEDKATVFEKYSEYGFAPVHLRQLLLFDDGKYSDYRQYFEGHCDTNSTLIYYYPEAPYEKNNYRVEYVHSCVFE